MRILCDLLVPIIAVVTFFLSTSAAMSAPSPIRTVMITGATGYLASHIVKQLLEKGYNVNACVRNASNESSVKHLLKLSSSSSSSGKLQLFSTGDMADKTLYGRYKEPLATSDAVFHAATPLSPKFKGEFDGMRDMLNPGMEGTKELLETMLQSPRCSSIQCFVLTSSMSAAAPVPEPNVKDESHWSDDDAQLARGNFYGCLKTRQEKMCQQWSEQAVQEGKLSHNFRYCAICPTMIVGPSLAAEDDDNYTPSGTMGSLYRVIKPTDGPSLIGQAVKSSKRKARNDSMSYIDVQDCAAHHVAAMENKNASGRYFSLVESWHWNDILSTLKELCPEITLDEQYKYEGDDIVRPTQFNLDRMNSLGVTVKSIKEIFEECISFFQSKGVL
mmetsp:Transcript_15177/g.24796  ORF Transcript_15177/g.24796 Transcript_15177/m.24796 type:complete len:387 (+) Transcript_15177:66-1226(+)